MFTVDDGRVILRVGDWVKTTVHIMNWDSYEIRDVVGKIEHIGDFVTLEGGDGRYKLEKFKLLSEEQSEENQRNKMKTTALDSRYVYTHSGVLNFPKEYMEKLVKSKDKDFIRLAEMNGKRISVMVVPQPALSVKDLIVNICDPFEGTIPAEYVKEMWDRKTTDEHLTRKSVM